MPSCKIFWLWQVLPLPKVKAYSNLRPWVAGNPRPDESQSRTLPLYHDNCGEGILPLSKPELV
ncbi:hypothetical protein SK128_004070 [Halocaridina rubra]|uniref:Uncharacterized protein n=1 Tax=Halocaridina rubra TaxID=373956 RepID=A0AAN8X3Z1_HALRR